MSDVQACDCPRGESSHDHAVHATKCASRQVVLIINRSESTCGACGLGADPWAKWHDRTLGYYATDAVKPEPCHRTFTHVRSDYIGMKQRCLEMRPDLEWAGFDETAATVVSP